jgi:probable F420-dependent oxidoreductase
VEKRKPAFGVGIPTGTEGLMYPIPFVNSIRDNIDIAVKAESLGYDSVWGNDHVATQKYVMDDFGSAPNYYAPLITLAAIAEHTSTLKIATALLVLPIRQPGILAKELSSLDQLSNGRLRLGVGLGAYREEFEHLYGEFSKGKNRGRMLDESLEIMSRLFAEDVVTFKGEFFSVKELRSTPKPVSSPFPFYIGGNSEKGMARVVKYGTGWLPSGFTVEEMKERVTLLGEMLGAAGRSIKEIDVAPQYTVALGRTHEEAWKKYEGSQQYRHMLSLANSTMKDFDLSDCVNRDLIGTPDELVERIHAYMEAGVNSFPAILFTANTLPEFYEEMQWFSEEVMSKINEDQEEM